MDKLLNISERVNIALHAIAYIAASGDNPVSSKKMAEDLKVSESYLAKVLQPIAKAGILSSSRGAKGGFLLEKDPKLLSALELIVMIDGPLPENVCLFQHPICRGNGCTFRKLTAEVKELIEKTLKETTVYDLMQNFK